MTRTLSFGTFRLLPEQRQLLGGGKAVRLGSRSLDILIALAERAGELVTKDELVSLVWPDTLVAEANLRVHIGALRRVLGDGRAGARYISNVPGRGYIFVARVDRIEAKRACKVRGKTPETSLPTAPTRIVGRSICITTLADQIRERRFVTIVGPGGIGKTTVAVAAAEQVAAQYQHGAHFVDFARLTDGKLVATVLAESLGVHPYADDPSQGVLEYLADKSALILLDCCEHVIEEAAALAEALVRAAPCCHVLSTSREPLRAAGESVHRLESLSCPPPGNALTATEVLTYPAAQLFVERAGSSSNVFHLSDEDAPTVAEICRRLDGIPLAIEFAAATVDLFGLQGLAAHLGDRLSLLTHGRRTALPRHQTLRATLDWSYELLPKSEKTILRRLAPFVGTFTIECGGAVAACVDIPVPDVMEGLANLVAKSLVTASLAGDGVCYRLLETTREYALEKLHQSGEAQTFFRRHAQRYSLLFRQKEEAWYATYGTDAVRGRSTIDNIRSALGWAFSDQGDATLGIELVAAAIPLWMCLSLMAECRRWTQHALATCRVDNPHYRMQLATALGYGLMSTMGATDDTRAAFEEALAHAEALGDLDYRRRALWGLSRTHLNNCRFRDALCVAERLYEATENSADGRDLPLGDRMIALSLHYMGVETPARRRLERSLSRHVEPSAPSHIHRFLFDLRITAQLVLGEIFWIQGQPDRALALVKSSIKEVISLDHPVTLCIALAKACPVMLFAGDLAAAEDYSSMLLETATRNSLLTWQAEARCYIAVLHIHKGDVRQGVTALRTALDELSGLNFSLRYSALLSELAQGHARIGEIEQGMTAIDLALARAEQLDERWCYPELLRIKGELVLSSGTLNAEQPAVEYFKRAIEAARGQDALSWELRAATSLAQIDKGSNVRGLLRSVYERFDEGFSTPDLQRAELLLERVPQGVQQRLRGRHC